MMLYRDADMTGLQPEPGAVYRMVVPVEPDYEAAYDAFINSEPHSDWWQGIVRAVGAALTPKETA